MYFWSIWRNAMRFCSPLTVVDLHTLVSLTDQHWSVNFKYVFFVAEYVWFLQVDQTKIKKGGKSILWGKIYFFIFGVTLFSLSTLCSRFVLDRLSVSSLRGAGRGPIGLKLISDSEVCRKGDSDMESELWLFLDSRCCLKSPLLSLVNWRDIGKRYYRSQYILQKLQKTKNNQRTNKAKCYFWCDAKKLDC